MLNENLTNELLKQELLKRDYVLNKIEKDNGWKGGKIPVPFRGAQASSVKFGALTAESDIAQSKMVRGNITDYVEVWASMIFNQRDLQEHDGKIPETTFLRILPDEIDDMMDYMKMVTSIQVGSGPHFSVVTDDTNAATGVFVVSKVDRFVINQHVVIDDDNSTALDVYVIAIDVNGGAGDEGSVTFSLTRGGAAANLSAYTEAQNAKFYYDGVTDGAGNFMTFVSMRQAFLSAANGGSSTLHGVSKLAYPHLQAVNIAGSTITASNILDKLFDGYTTVRQKARGNASTILMSFKHLGSIMKLIETQKGPYKVTKDPNASLYGWTEIEITSVRGTLVLVGIQEMDDDVIFYVDWGALKFMSNGFFKKRKSPDGLEYHEVRNTTGYQYIVDISLFGEMMYTKAGNCGVIYGISY
jgi:hypothetical protein